MGLVRSLPSSDYSDCMGGFSRNISKLNLHHSSFRKGTNLKLEMASSNRKTLDPSTLPLARIKKMILAVNYVNHPEIKQPDNLRKLYNKYFLNNEWRAEGCIKSELFENFNFEWYSLDSNDKWLDEMKNDMNREIQTRLSASPGDKVVVSNSFRKVSYDQSFATTVSNIEFYIFYLLNDIIQYRILTIKCTECYEFGCDRVTYEVESHKDGGESLLTLFNRNPSLLPHVIHRYSYMSLVNSLNNSS